VWCGGAGLDGNRLVWSAGGAGMGVDLDMDLVCVGGIFDGVGEEVDQDLFDLGSVGHDKDLLFGEAAFDDVAGVDLPDRLDAFFDELGQGCSSGRIVQFAGVYAGDVEKVGDEAVELVDLSQGFFDKIFCQAEWGLVFQ